MKSLMPAVCGILCALLLCPGVFNRHALASDAAGEEYRVGVDDMLEVNIIQPEKTTIMVTVSPDGSIALPYIGTLPVSGQSLSQIKQVIETKLTEGYFKYPLIAVSLKESRSKKILIQGDVSRPGSYVIEQGMTVLKAISLAGGVSDFGAVNKVTVVRPQSTADQSKTQKMDVDMKSALGGVAEADIAIKPGDMVVVEAAKFFVYGEVNKPGEYPLDEHTSILKAVSLAGGLTKFGSLSRVKILRPRAGGADEILEGGRIDTMVLERGDTVVVSGGVF